MPLNHFGTLIGFVVLARSRAQFKLDREVFDLLRVVGREVASRVAEQRAAQVLSQTQQLREYSQRFAFVIHDIKNVSGQLSMLLTNAEVHADNPEFQRDMLATVRASVGKITRLLSRLQAERQERDHALIDAGAAACATSSKCDAPDQPTPTIELDRRRRRRCRRRDRPGCVRCGRQPSAEQRDRGVAGAAHRCASTLRHEALSVVVDIVDEGPGMTPEFVRDELFRPFRTTKGGGHGIGAYQARELLREAGGDLLVLSRAGIGTTMRLMLPAVRPGRRRYPPRLTA